MNDNAQKLEAIIAREIMDLGKEYSTDPSVLESLSEICFTFSRFLETVGRPEESVVDWDKIFSIYDQAYTHLNKGQSPINVTLEKEYRKAADVINK